jgi:hypothetical protein
MKRFSDLNITINTDNFSGEKIKINQILNKSIIIIDYKVVKSKFKDKTEDCLYLAFKYNNNLRITFTGSKILINILNLIQKDDFPFETKIKLKNKGYIFT